MNEEFNPYLNAIDRESQPTEQLRRQPEAPQPVPQPVAPQPMQPHPPVPPMPPRQGFDGHPAPPVSPGQQAMPQTFTNQRPVTPVKRDSRGAAKAFGMVSFIIGCFVLPVTSMIYFNFRSSVSEKFSASIWFSLMLSVPALIFGVISLMKKTEKRLFPILGIAFACLLMLCAFITYFFMVNAEPVSVYSSLKY